MPLDLLELGSQVRQMGELLTARRADEQRRIELLEVMLAEYGDRWGELADLAETVQERVAVPTGPLEDVCPRVGVAHTLKWSRMRAESGPTA